MTSRACSEGRVAIQVLPTGAVVQYNETLDAVASGLLTGHMTDPSYFAGRDPAFGLIGNMVGAWSDPREMIAFLEEGGGYEIYRELSELYGLHLIGATSTGLEALVSTVPIRSVDDLKGVKIRAPEGMVNDVFAAAGATPVNLPSSEVYSSLDKGVIDAADYTVFSSNHAIGLHEFARYPLYPGFHSMPMLEVAMNLELWRSLPEDLQACVTEETRAFGETFIDELRALDEAAVADAREQGIEVIDWPEEERRRFRSFARDRWADPAEQSDVARRWSDAVVTWLEEQGKL